MRNADLVREAIAFLLPTWGRYSTHAIAKALHVSPSRLRRVLENDERFEFRFDEHAGRRIRRWQLADWRAAREERK